MQVIGNMYDHLEVAKDKTVNVIVATSGDTGFNLQTGKATIFGVEVSFDDYNEFINTPHRDQGDKAQEILSRY